MNDIHLPVWLIAGILISLTITVGSVAHAVKDGANKASYNSPEPIASPEWITVYEMDTDYTPTGRTVDCVYDNVGGLDCNWPAR